MVINFFSKVRLKFLIYFYFVTAHRPVDVFGWKKNPLKERCNNCSPMLWCFILLCCEWCGVVLCCFILLCCEWCGVVLCCFILLCCEWCGVLFSDWQVCGLFDLTLDDIHLKSQNTDRKSSLPHITSGLQVLSTAVTLTTFSLSCIVILCADTV